MAFATRLLLALPALVLLHQADATLHVRSYPQIHAALARARRQRGPRRRRGPGAGGALRRSSWDPPPPSRAAGPVPGCPRHPPCAGPSPPAPPWRGSWCGGPGPDRLRAAARLERSARALHPEADAPRRIGLLRAAPAADPEDGSLRLELARALWNRGEEDGALCEIEEAAAAGSLLPSPQATAALRIILRAPVREGDYDFDLVPAIEGCGLFEPVPWTSAEVRP